MRSGDGGRRDGADIGRARGAGRQPQDRHRRVIVVQHVALRGLANQLVHGRLQGRAPWSPRSPIAWTPAAGSARLACSRSSR